MRKLKVFGIALAAVFAIGVTVVSSVSAAVTFSLSGFLEAGGSSWKEEEVNTTGELVLEDNKAPIVGKAAVKCSGTLHGLILGPSEPSHVVIESVLGLSGEAISSTQLSGTALSCANVTNCGSAEVWPAHLPWLSEIELMVDGAEEFFAVLLASGGSGNPGWEVKCPLLTDECTAETGIAKLENLAGGIVDAAFSESFTLLAELPLAECSASKEKSGVVEGEGSTTTTLGGALTVSSLVNFLLAGFLEAGGSSWKEEEVNTTGELVLEDNKAPIVGKAAVKCSGTLMGLILGQTEPSHVMIESVLDLSGTAISSTQLSGSALSCANVTNCGSAEVWPAHLPWLSEIELMVDGAEEFFAVLLASGGSGNPGWEVKCPLLTDECTAETGIAKLENLAGGIVDAAFSESFTLLAELPLATCSASGAMTGVVEGEGSTTTTLGGALTVSSLE